MVAILEERGTRVGVVYATVLDVEKGTIIIDFPVDQGDSGGGIFLSGEHIGNTTQRIEITTYNVPYRIGPLVVGATTSRDYVGNVTLNP